VGDVSTHPWEPEDFIDEGHFSARGSLAFAEILAAHIRELGNRRTVRNLSAAR
jgi:lysophospholipase L1-like esterase